MKFVRGGGVETTQSSVGDVSRSLTAENQEKGWVSCLHLFSCVVIPDSLVWFPEAGTWAFINLHLPSIFLLSYCRSFLWRVVAKTCFLYWHAVIPAPKHYSKRSKRSATQYLLQYYSIGNGFLPQSHMNFNIAEIAGFS